MFSIFASPSPHNLVQPAGSWSLSTNCIPSPYFEISNRMTLDSAITCQVQHCAYKSSYTQESWHKIKVNPLLRYIRTLKWTPIPLGVGFAYIAYQQFRHVRKRETSKIASATDPSDLLAPSLYVSMYTFLPLRTASRFWGWVHHLELPLPIRTPILNLFVSMFGCDLQEAVVEDIGHYKSLGDFFGRQLKKEFRPIHPGKCLVSPSDGQVLHFGRIQNGLVEQVKGITYSLKSFLGIDPSSSEDSQLVYEESLLRNKDNALYNFIIYLAPGDYHKFHSPVEWKVTNRRHFHGELLSVRPGLVSLIAGLFNLNERVVYTGEWQHGFFSLTAVGATNVGSIRVFFDEGLQTNQKRCRKGTFEERSFSPPISMTEKGERFGEFNLGSTIVLVFEAPKGIQFNVTPGQRIKYGELITLCDVS